ncbi:MAG: alpha-mannosidase [Candidatus Microthrix parvicella]|nr:alpha-mannosidase [Candidatus Microthrix parvicella]
MHDEPHIAERRIRRLLDERIRPVIYGPGAPLAVTAHHVDGEPIGVDEAEAATFAPFSVGDPWGPAWGTTWFRMSGTVPPEMAGRRVEAVVDLGFVTGQVGFNAEGLVWRDGAPLHGLHPARQWSLISADAQGGERANLLVEAAANPFVNFNVTTQAGDVLTAAKSPLYRLARAELAPLNTEVWHLALEIDFLLRLGWQLDTASGSRKLRLMRALGGAADALDLDDVVGSAAAARAELAEVLAAPAVASEHRTFAIGHAHIDTAWLWPLRETHRKCARSFANSLDLIANDPDYRFGCSQAVQYQWMIDEYPSVAEGIAEAVAADRWVPLGGMWVEADGNLPSGEAMARQFLHGQRFFREHYGVTCREAWIPDVFGYPASLPQIFALGGADAFVTQKISWNRTNTFPHHTFLWEGLDGTTLPTHFPPANTYNSEIDPGELVPAARTFAERAVANTSLLPFGHGDGGGGPTREMMARITLASDLESVPRVAVGSPAEFFAEALAELPDPPRWVGELYLEMHRATYTAQAKTKAGNRRSEALLREVEWWALTATGGGPDDAYPLAELDELRKEMLTLQFHDILPGSSIAWVHREAEDSYGRIIDRCEALIADSLGRVVSAASGSVNVMLANPAPHPRPGVHVVSWPDGVPHPPGSQLLADGRVAIEADLPAGGWAEPSSDSAIEPVLVVAAPDGGGTTANRTMTNGLLTLTWDDDGLVTSLVDHRVTGDREVLRSGEGGNVLELSEDLPLEFDAWDLEAYYANSTEALTVADSVEVIDHGPMVASLRITRSHGRSTFTQVVQMVAGSPRIDIAYDIDWAETDKVLKVAWPVDVHTHEVASEIQYGHVVRPVHQNTSWDAARFEFCAHRWIDASERGYGVALLNDAKYGHDALDGTLRQTLLTASTYPDPAADKGRHHFTLAVLPHLGDLAEGEVVTEGWRLNNPVRAAPVAGASGDSGATSGSQAVAPAPPVTCEIPGVTIEAAKAAEDGSGDLVVRLAEVHGARVSGTITLGAPARSVQVCDLLEDELSAVDGRRDGTEAQLMGDTVVEVTLHPFKVLTLRFRS